MDVKQFVSESIIQFIQGVIIAQAEAAKLGAAVSPGGGHLGTTAKRDDHIGYTTDKRHVFVMDFDIAVTVAESGAADAGAKLAVAGVFSVGGGGTTASGHQSVSRISMSVPIVLPADERVSQEPAHLLNRRPASAQTD